MRATHTNESILRIFLKTGHTNKYYSMAIAKRFLPPIPKGPRFCLAKSVLLAFTTTRMTRLPSSKGKIRGLMITHLSLIIFLLSERFLKILVVQRWVLCLLENLEYPLIFIPLLNLRGLQFGIQEKSYHSSVIYHRRNTARLMTNHSIPCIKQQ